MAELGNNIVNRILEGKTGERQKPGPESTRAEREAWIFAKYRDKLFVDKDIFKAEEFQAVLRIRRIPTFYASDPDFKEIWFMDRDPDLSRNSKVNFFRRDSDKKGIIFLSASTEYGTGTHLELNYL
jgi:hypothetical protein